MSPLLKKGLYAITPNMVKTEVLLTKVELVLKGGIALLQYRDKISTPAGKALRAYAIHQLCLKYKVPLIINDDPELALACQAEGVHLGQTDGSIQFARRLLGEKAIIGMTCHHDLSLAITAEKQGANYVAFGRFFHSSTKPGAPFATIETLINAKKTLSIPVVAIGGIKLCNAKPLVDKGADYLAVAENIFSADNVSESCQGFSKLFPSYNT